MENNLNEIDIELLIGEVKKYPEIWNLADESYCDRTKKRAAWANVCRLFSESFDEKSDKEKNEICNKIAKRWRNIRDTYARSLRKINRSGQAAETTRKYIYAAQLSFLATAGARTETQSSLEETINEDDTEQQNGLQQQKQKEGSGKSPRYEENSARKRKRDLEVSLIEFMKTPVPQPVAAPPNADRSFFDSLLPSIKDFTEDQKLEFRSEVLTIVKRMRMSNNVNLQNTSRHASISNLSYSIPNLTQPQFSRSFTPLLSNSPNNFFPEGRSSQIANSYSSSNIPSLSTNFVPQIPTNLYSSPNLSSQPFSQALSARCSTPRSPSIDSQSYNDDENIDLFKDT